MDNIFQSLVLKVWGTLRNFLKIWAYIIYILVCIIVYKKLQVNKSAKESSIRNHSVLSCLTETAYNKCMDRKKSTTISIVLILPVKRRTVLNLLYFLLLFLLFQYKVRVKTSVLHCAYWGSYNPDTKWSWDILIGYTNSGYYTSFLQLLLVNCIKLKFNPLFLNFVTPFNFIFVTASSKSSIAISISYQLCKNSASEIFLNLTIDFCRSRNNYFLTWRYA